MNRVSVFFFLAVVYVASVVCAPPRLKAQDREPQEGAAKASPGTVRTALPPHASSTEAERDSARAAYVKLPLYFEHNVGQAAGDVKFTSHGLGYGLFLTSTEAVLSTQKSGGSGAMMRMKLAGANAAPRVAGLEELPGRANYFIGNDPAKWRTNVPTYQKVYYQDVYPGVDLIYYGHQQQLEYDFVVAPGADPRAIRIHLRGARRIEVNAFGDLVAHAGAGALVFHKPLVYQQKESGGADKEFVDGRFVLKGRHEVTFEVARYDTARPLVIDPSVNFSTFLGGSAEDAITAVQVDFQGRIYVAGWTRSSNFNTTANVYQSVNKGPTSACALSQDNTCGGDAFVARILADGSALDYSTYYGGSGVDRATGLAVDFSSHAIIVGGTFSNDLPTTANAFQQTCPNCTPSTPQNAFIAELDSTGGTLLYASYLGGLGNAGATTASGIALDIPQHPYIVGSTQNSAFPATTGAFLTTFAGTTDAFVAKFDTTKSGAASLLAATFLGAAGGDTLGKAITVEHKPNGSVYLTGGTNTPSFPVTAGAKQTTFGGAVACPPLSFAYPVFEEVCGDAFVTKFDAALQNRAYSTFLGGKDFDMGLGITVDAAGDAFVVGGSNSSDFSTTDNSHPTPYTDCTKTGNYCGSSPFWAVLDPTGSTLLHSAFIPGTGYGVASAVALDSLENIHMAGVTNSTDLPVLNAAQKTLSGGTNVAGCTNPRMFCGEPWFGAFSAMTSGNFAPMFLSYVNGGTSDTDPVIALNPRDSSLVLAGETASSDLPTSHESGTTTTVQTASGGTEDGFLQGIQVFPNSCSVTWTGPTNTLENWHQPAMWSTGQLPGPDDWVCMNGADLYIDTVEVIGNIQDSSDMSNVDAGTLDIQASGSLTIGNPPGYVGRMNNLMLEGTLVVNTNITAIGTFAFNNGTITTSFSFSVDGLTTCKGGKIDGPNNGQSGMIAAGGITLTGVLDIDTIHFFNGGVGTMSGPLTEIFLANGAFVSNYPQSATFDVTNSLGISGTPGVIGVINTGTFMTSVTGMTTPITGVFENNGTLNVNAGTLSLSGGSETSGGGSINVAAGATLEFGGPVISLAPQDIAGAGTVQWNPATNAFLSGGFNLSGVQVPATYNVTGTSEFLSGGTFFGSASGPVTVTSLGTTTIDNALLTFSANGTAVTVSQPITMNSAAVLNNQIGSTVTFTNDSAITASGATAPIFNNFDKLIKSGGTSPTGTVIEAVFNHTGGSFEINTGSVTLQNGGTISSRVDLLSGGDFNFQTGKFTVSNILNGFAALAEGAYNIAQAATVDLQKGATLNDAIMNNSGAVTLSGDLTMQSGPVIFNNQTGASFTITNDSSIIAIGPPPPVFNNMGQFTKAGGTLTAGSSIEPTFNHTGGGVSVNIGAGTLSFAGGGMFNAPATVANGGKLAFGAGTYALTSTLTGPGTYEIGGATVNFNAGAAMPAGANAPTLNLLDPGVANLAGVALNPDTFKFSGGTLNGPGAVNVPTLFSWSGGTMAGGGTLNLAAASTSLLANNLTNKGWNINNAGSLTMSGPGNALVVNMNATLTNLAGATWDFGDYTSVGDILTNVSMFNNLGTAKKSLAGPAPQMLSTQFNNQNGGVFQIQAGAVTLLDTNNCGTNCAGAYTLGNGAQVQFGSGNFLTSGAFNAAGGTVTVQGAGPGAFPVLDLLGPGAVNVGTVAIGSAGKLIVEKPVIATMNNVNITGGGVLTGQGTITGNIVNTSGTVQPGPQGAGLDKLTVTGNYTQAVGGTLQENIAGQGLAAGGVNYDQLVVTGTANISGTMTGILTPPYIPPVPKLGDQITLIRTGGASGFFSTNNIQSPAGTFWTIANTPTGIVATLATSAKLVSIAVTPNPASVAAGATQQFAATGTFSDNSMQDLTNSVTWSSSDTTIATITAAGLAKGVKAGGPVTIKAVSGTINGTAPLTVTAPTLSGISVTPNPASVAAGATQQFTATGTFSDNSMQDLTNSVTWSSSDTTIATITTGGLAKGVKAGGPVTIKAVSGTINGTAPLTVTSATLSSIAVTPNPASVAAGATQQFTATGTFSDNSMQDLTNSVTWSSSDATIATISATGLATGVKTGGPVTIKAVSGAVNGTAPLTVTSGAPANVTVTAGSGQSEPINTGFATAFQVTVTDKNGTPVPNVTVTFTAPSSGASGSFGTLASAQATTNLNGVATAPAFTANGTAGAYIVTAKAGTAASANISLTNVDFAVVQDASNLGTIQVTAGTPANIKLDVNSSPAGALLPANVSFACRTPLPAGSSCSFNPPTLAAGSPSGSSSTLTFHSTSSSGMMGSVPSIGGNGEGRSYPLGPIAAGLLIMLVILAVNRRRTFAPQRWLAYLTLVLLTITVMTLMSCTTANSGGGGSSVTPTPKGSANITVTATSGADSQPIVIKINVN